jgi:hypothetical protein
MASFVFVPINFSRLTSNSRSGVDSIPIDHDLQQCHVCQMHQIVQLELLCFVLCCGEQTEYPRVFAARAFVHRLNVHLVCLSELLQTPLWSFSPGPSSRRGVIRALQA